MLPLEIHKLFLMSYELDLKKKSTGYGKNPLWGKTIFGLLLFPRLFAWTDLCLRQCRSCVMTPPPQVRVQAVHLAHSPHQYVVTSSSSSRLLEATTSSWKHAHEQIYTTTHKKSFVVFHHVKTANSHCPLCARLTSSSGSFVKSVKFRELSFWHCHVQTQSPSER